MNSFLSNKTSLTGVVDITANSISLYDDENETPQNIKDTFMFKSNISKSKPYDVVIDEFGNSIQMYQFIGPINDTKVAGLESLLNYMNENFFSKDEQQVYDRQYNITKNNTLTKQITYTILIKVNLIR